MTPIPPQTRVRKVNGKWHVEVWNIRLGHWRPWMQYHTFTEAQAKHEEAEAAPRGQHQ